jgi:hypothetical protein
MEAQRITEVKETKFGKGVFAKTVIPKNTVLFSVDENWRRLNFETTTRLGNRESHALQISLTEYVLLQPPVLCVNHSCNPNCGFNKKLQLFTLRDINVDEELFWDYSTSMFEHGWTMPCKCGSPQCRNIVTDFDLLPATVQNK